MILLLKYSFIPFIVVEQKNFNFLSGANAGPGLKPELEPEREPKLWPKVEPNRSRSRK